jgi:membrane-associated phospholipid phosphatase
VLGLPKAGAVMHTGQEQVNAVAAVPSLHTAFAVLTCLVLLPLTAHLWQRVVLVAYAVLMPVVLVWSGEHYVVDTLLGAVYAGAVWVLVPRAVRLVRRRPEPAAA